MNQNLPWNLQNTAQPRDGKPRPPASSGRRSRWLRRSVGAAALACAGVVSAATVKDSADFNLKLEMDEVPAAVFGSNKGWTSDGDVMTFNDAQNGDGAFGWTGRLVNSKGYTIELRYQITEVNTPGTTTLRKYVFQFQGADGSGAQSLNTIQVGMPVADSQLGLYSLGHNLGHPITAGEWHTLRIAEEPNSNALLVWSDGVEIVGFDWQSGNNTVNRAWVGDLGTGITDGNYRVDYFRVDDTGAYAPPEPAAPVVAQSPQSITNDLGARITLRGEFSGLVSWCQWYKDNEPLAEANNPTYVIDPATAADSGWYFLRATNALGSVDTEPAYVKVLEVNPTPPAVQAARELFTLQHVRVTFTKPMLEETMVDIANYSFQGDALAVLGATRVDQYTVELQTSFQTPGANYTLLINNVRDSLSNLIAPNTSVSLTAPLLTACVRYDAGTAESRPGGPPDPVSAEGGSWLQTTNLNNGMLTNAIVDDLGTGLNAWQITDQNVLSSGGVLDYRMVVDQPSDNLAHANGWRLMARCRLADSFGSTSADQAMLYSDTGLGTRYGVLFGMDLNGNLTATLLGGAVYTLTGDPSSYHTHILIYDPTTSKASYYFDGQPIVTSYGGQPASGYNGLAFGSASSTAAGQMNYNLVQFDVLGASQPVILANPQSSTNGVGQKVTFTASFSPFVGAYQWFSNSVAIPGATNTTYTTDFITLGYDGSQYTCRALHALGNVDTVPAILTVTSDTTPPSIVAVKQSLTLDRILITYSEPVLALYATNLANYTWLDAALTSVAVTLLDPMTVELRTTPQQMGASYTLRVSNVRDTSNLPIVANSPASFTAPWLEVVARYYAGTVTNTPDGPPDPTSPAGGGWAWRPDAGFSTNAVIDDLGTGWNAWGIRDASTTVNNFLQYTMILATNVHQLARQQGWVMTVRSRVAEDLGTAYTICAGYGDYLLNRNLMFFDLNAAGDLTADLSTGGTFKTYVLTSDGVGAMDYHLHQIAYDPATTNASYYCDGQLIASVWPPSYTASATSGLLWGSGSSGNMGAVNFNLIEFKTVAVPSVELSVDGETLNVQYRGVLEAADQLTGQTAWSPVATNSAGGVYSVPLNGQAQQYFRARLQ